MSSQIPGLYIGYSEHRGRGVYSGIPIDLGDDIEICPVIIISKEDLRVIHNTILHDYYFMWDLEAGEGAIALGYGSLYNHSSEPNAEYLLQHEDMSIKISCINPIKAGEEITIDYQSLKTEQYALWFDEK